MNQKQIRKWIDKYAWGIVKDYGLERWDITINVCSSPENDTCKAECCPNAPYYSATINIYIEMAEDVLDLEESLRHELEHLIISPYQLVRELVDVNIPKRLKSTFDTMFVNCEEMARSNIGKLRQNLINKHHK